MGLLTELARAYPIELGILARRPLDDSQTSELSRYTSSIWEIMRRESLRDRLAIAVRAAARRVPYHMAMIDYSFERAPAQARRRPQPEDCVYATRLHWMSALRSTPGYRWILDQADADVHFWQVYARQARDPLLRFAAVLNGWLTYSVCRDIYPRTGRIVSVCEEDRALTLSISPRSRVDVIANGVDCDDFSPARMPVPEPTLLFTGTSAPRNLRALRFFVLEVLPRIRHERPDVYLVVAGDFSPRAQAMFHGLPGVAFTGPLPDLRPLYNRSAIFVNPFFEAHGSKVKVSEALAMAIPIVSLPGGLRGLPVVDGESVILARDASDMADQVLRLLSNPELAAKVGNSGRQVALAHLDWKRVLGPRLRRLVDEVMMQVPEERESTPLRALGPEHASPAASSRGPA